MFNHEKLNCYQMALDLTKGVPDLVRRWPCDLSDQLKRAASSIVLNIAEGNAKVYPKDRRKFFVIALGSLNECSAIMDVAVAYQLIEKELCDDIKSQLLSILKMLYKLH